MRHSVFKMCSSSMYKRLFDTYFSIKWRKVKYYLEVIYWKDIYSASIFIERFADYVYLGLVSGILTGCHSCFQRWHVPVCFIWHFRSHCSRLLQSSPSAEVTAFSLQTSRFGKTWYCWAKLQDFHCFQNKRQFLHCSRENSCQSQTSLPSSFLW